MTVVVGPHDFTHDYLAGWKIQENLPMIPGIKGLTQSATWLPASC